MGLHSETSLAPGFRFHPTDEELVRYYLKRKVSGKPFRFDPISVIDIYKSEPWDLPIKSKLKSRDLEWYFFSALDRKYGNSSRTNRATEMGYWKTTGKDRTVRQNSRAVGMKKTLVYHSGRAPHGARTNWVMHEYRLVDEELEKTGIAIDSFVLCRVFQKSGTGPKNGEHYGAPFIEEEWEEDDVAAFLPCEEAAVDDVVVGDGACVEAIELDQDLEISNPSESTPPPLNFYYGDTSNDVEQYEDFVEDCQKPIMGSGETFELCHDEKLVDIPEQYEMDMKPIKDEFFVESSRIMKPSEVNYSLDEPYLDATDNPLLGDGFFLESDDLLNPVESDAAGFDILDEYLTFLNADDDMAFDPSEIMGGENSFSNQATHTQEHLNGGTEKVYIDGQQPSEAQGSNDASTSKQKPEAAIYESDIKNPFIKHATRMLGSIPAPPAYASEFPAKDVTLQLHSAAQSSSSVHVTTGVIRIRNTTLTSHGTDWLLGKNSDVNFGMPFLLPQGDTNSANLVPMAGLHAAGKTASVVSWGWFFLIFFWALILSVSFRFASNIYIK
ncbi:NAC domain-containing protein 53-like [Juglans regia]|uniref:NAC domain-containing protein 53-like n=2 Tax=Juglans regia TaxID=51240 RepID=A0A2I4GVX6_JUGRE|nr:NAC domain-containing protein 53-like [Juglans regia]